MLLHCPVIDIYEESCVVKVVDRRLGSSERQPPPGVGGVVDISVFVTIVPLHQMRSWTSHLFGGVCSMVPVRPGGSISNSGRPWGGHVDKRARPTAGNLSVDRECPAAALVAESVVGEG
jgi:hypothetical protein